MGIAASQARFLNLTARKSNIEYEGQQINQQRTTLANQSANYYNSMLTLTVPTPPSSDSYKTIVYTVSNGNTSFNINQITSDGNGNYNVSYTNSYEQDVFLPVNGDANNSQYAISNVDGQYSNGTRSIVEVTSSNSAFTDSMIAQIKSEIGVDENDKLYYMNVGTDKYPSYVYFNSNDLSNSTATGYSEQSQTKYQQGVWENVSITRDANNRLSSITIPSLNLTNASVSSSTITDDDAYDDAYNEYEYQTYLYQQQMEEINAQTSVIQAQDKKLELRLKQLDTEESALSTEAESISSLLDKNVEDSYKIFA